MKKEDFFNKVYQSFVELSDEFGENTTVWQAFLHILGKNVDKSLVSMIADLPILESLASGMSVRAVARNLGMSGSDVYGVAKIWGIQPVNETIDFNPFLVYNSGMTPDQLEIKMEDLLPIRLSKSTYSQLINNIERYNDLLSFVTEKDT